MIRKFTLIILCASVLMASSASAVTLAVFPVEDLSLGRNGVNFPLTDFLRQNLQQRGMDVIMPDRLMAFMAKKRIRWLGFLDSQSMYEIRDELGVDLVLLGTVSQRSEKPVSSLGMILTAVRTSDGRHVWSESGGLCCADVCNLLAVGQPENEDDLLPLLAERLLKSWPREIPMGGESVRLAVASTDLSPRHVRPGEKVHCRIQLRSSREELELPQVLLMVGDDDYLPMREVLSGMYEVSWLAPNRDGSIPVSLVLDNSQGDKEIIYVGSYEVDNSAPKLLLNVKGTKLSNGVAFSHDLPVFPQWLEPEPVSRWSFVAYNSRDEVVAASDGKGNLPIRIIWKGLRENGYKAPDGTYSLVLKVWDRAGNESVAVEKVLLHSSPPAPLLVVEPAMNGLLLRMGMDGETEVPVSHWSVEVFYSDGETLLARQGETLPVDFRLPLPSSEETRKLEARVKIQDVLGNRKQQKIDDLTRLIKTEVEAEEEEIKEESWVTGF